MPPASPHPQQALAALHRAALAIAHNQTLDEVLTQIVSSARELAGAHYAALGIPAPEGRLADFIHVGMGADLVARIDHLPRGLGLLGVILRDGRALRVDNIAADPQSVGFPDNHPPMTSFLGVPVLAGDKVLGNLYLTDKLAADGETPIPFTEADEQLMKMFAAHAAVAVQNARLQAEIGRLAVVEERSRIGMDLHDGVIQDIYAVGLTLESARLQLTPEQTAVVQMLDRAVDGLNGTIHDMRNFILDLRPRRFDGNLAAGLARLAREFQANTMIPVNLEAPAARLEGIPSAIAQTLFLTGQEALANVARHAKATAVHLTLSREPGRITLIIADNGVGFDPDRATRATGHGLANMRARAATHDGTFTIRAAPGDGTEIRLAVPV